MDDNGRPISNFYVSFVALCSSVLRRMARVTDRSSAFLRRTGVSVCLPLALVCVGVGQSSAWAQGGTVLPSSDNGRSLSVSSNPGSPAKQNLDRVVIRQGLTEATRLSLWKPLKRSEQFGRISHLDNREMLIEVEGDTDQVGLPTARRLRIPCDQIESVDPVWQDDSTKELVQLFERRMYREFIQALRERDLAAIPQWQQLLLLNKVVQAVDAVQGPTASANPFLRMAESAPDFLYASMPLCWTFSEMDRDFKEKCRTWMESPSEVAQLLGASWLLQDTEGHRAAQVISQLQSSSNNAVAQLSAAQAWRLIPPPDTMNQIAKWIAIRDRMLLPLSLGPTEFLVERLSRVGQPDLAVGQALWIATMSPGDSARVARSLGKAAELLSAGGYQTEAQRVFDWRKELLGAAE